MPYRRPRSPPGACSLIGLKVKSSGSWLDAAAAPLLGWILGKRLFQRVQGEKGLFLTLTYRRDEYDDARDLYLRQGERQDVPLFLRRLSRATGLDFKGKWLCKLEFQRGGWVHFHILLIGPEFIDHSVLERCWSFGHVWVKRMTKKNVFYLTKYVAKGGQCPAWLYGDAPRSFKAIRVSPGFWGPVISKPALEPGDASWQRTSQTISGWVPVGLKLRQGRGVMVKSERGRYSVKCDPGTFLTWMGQRHRCRRIESGWLWYEADCFDVSVGVGACHEAVARCGETRPQARGPRSEPPRSGGLHLIQTGNPDAYVPAWLVEIWHLQDSQEREADYASA